MTLIYSFFSIFSIRLGSIIVGAFHFVESVLLLAACGVLMQAPQDVTARLTEWSKEKDLLFMTSIIGNVTRDPSYYLNMSGGAGLAYSITCVLLIYGAFVLNMWLIIPFVILEFGRLLFLTGFVVVSMLILKKNSLDLGLLMGGSIGGAFFLLLLFYLWACPLSLSQALHDLRHDRKKAEKKNKIDETLEQASIRLQDVSLSKPPAATAANMWNNNKSHWMWHPRRQSQSKPKPQPDPYTYGYPDGGVPAFYIE